MLSCIEINNRTTRLVLLVAATWVSTLSSSVYAHAYPTGSYCGGGHGSEPLTRVDVLTDNEVALCLDGTCVTFDYKSVDEGDRIRMILTDQNDNGKDRVRSSILFYDAERNRILHEGTSLRQELCHTFRHTTSSSFHFSAKDDAPIRLPALNIEKGSVVTAGCSHAGDFASQFHIAFSSLVSGSCVFSGQPYHCAVEHFQRDYLVPQNNATGVPNCDGCPDGYTLLYDHCKNHPQYVDVGQLVDYPRRACGQNPITKDPCIDDPKHLYDARSYIFHPTHDRCYLPGSVENTADLYGMLMTDPARQIKFVNDQPFPHTLPKNSTPYFNHSDPAGFDGPGECLRWVYGPNFGYDPLKWATDPIQENIFVFDQSEFVDDWGVGMKNTSLIYIPTACLPPELNNGTSSNTMCKLMFMLGVDFDFARYSELNNIVIVGMQIGGYVDQSRFPNACEVLRGLSDVYGQLSTDYAMQSGYQMRVGGRILRRLMGLDGYVPSA